MNTKSLLHRLTKLSLCLLSPMSVCLIEDKKLVFFFFLKEIRNWLWIRNLSWNVHSIISICINSWACLDYFKKLLYMHLISHTSSMLIFKTDSIFVLWLVRVHMLVFVHCCIIMFYEHFLHVSSYISMLFELILVLIEDSMNPYPYV